MIPYRFLPGSERELDAAAERYEHERQDLGSDFLDAVAAVLNRARHFPQIGTRLNDAGTARAVRRYLLRRFPYKFMGGCAPRC